jgi:RHS repeat-associated protein
LGFSCQPATLNLGNGDSDVFNFDANTGRMTKYQFNVGAQSVTGNLTWNANGTLQQHAITDGVNAANTQTCQYAHDDLVRISSANCGSVWSQTFSYDPFGNLSKSGTSSFQPIYKDTSGHTSNKYVSVPGTTVGYDLNGNVTSDGSHTYALNSENRPVTIDTVSLTYDALGRMVEQARGASYTQIVYAPSGGKFALMSGATLQKAWVPLPGGATAVYTSSGLDHYQHSDYLGNVRLGSTSTRTVSFDVAYAPFGESYNQWGTPDFSFAGNNQDTVAGNYDAVFRQYATQGRWPSPDPAGLAAVDPTNPQSWNRYAYVVNNPLNLADPSGLKPYQLLCAPAGTIGDIQCQGQSSGPGGGAGTAFFGNDLFDIIQLAFTPTLDCSQNADFCGANGLQTTYGNLGILSLLGGTGNPGAGPDGNTSAPNNSRNCTPNSASVGQYVAATAEVALLTAEFGSGLGAGNQTFGPNTATSQVLAQSAGVQEVLGAYLFTGQTSGLYTFGASGAYVAGGNPVAQFVGSFRYTITPGVGGIILSITNTTSVKSLTYDRGPQYQRGSFPTPGGNTHQTYNIFAPCKVG